MGKISQESTLLLIANALQRPAKSLPSSSVTIDTSTALVINANKKRRGLVLTNTGSNAVFLGIDQDAVANQGIYLSANGGTWIMTNFTYTNKKINAIAISAATNIAIQEFQ